MFRSDYPRGVVNCFWLWCFSALDAFAVAPALTVPFLLARRRLPISLLGFPARPFPRRLPAALAAIALPRLPGVKAMLTPFEETPARPWSARRPPPPPGLLFFGWVGRILGRAHGR
jgi:hypothetical protein